MRRALVLFLLALLGGNPSDPTRQPGHSNGEVLVDARTGVATQVVTFY